MLFRSRFGRWSLYWRAAALFFVLHTAGYFAGGQSMAFLMDLSHQKPAPLLEATTWSVLAKLSWGLFYGLGFGGGLGSTFAVLQKPAGLPPSATGTVGG